MGIVGVNKCLWTPLEWMYLIASARCDLDRLHTRSAGAYRLCSEMQTSRLERPPLVAFQQDSKHTWQHRISETSSLLNCKSEYIEAMGRTPFGLSLGERPVNEETRIDLQRKVDELITGQDECTRES
jgi:hypothetical protein